ncbi:LysR substrate binding domain-containing protein, partial [Paraburkholderia tropica]
SPCTNVELQPILFVNTLETWRKGGRSCRHFQCGLRRENFLLLDMDEHLRTVESYWGPFGVAPRVRSTSIEAVRSLVALGEGVTILSDLVYRPWSLEGKRISRRDLSVAVPTMDVGAVWCREVPLSKQVHALLDLFRSRNWPES